MKFFGVLPRNAGTFFTSRVPTCLKASAVSRTNMISSAESSRRPSRSLRVQRILIRLLLQQPDTFFLIFRPEPDAHFFVGRGWQIFADVIGPNRQLAMSAIDQDGQLDAGRSAKGTDRVHGRSNGSTGVKDVVDNDDSAIFQWQRQFGH